MHLGKPLRHNRATLSALTQHFSPGGSTNTEQTYHMELLFPSKRLCKVTRRLLAYGRSTQTLFYVRVDSLLLHMNRVFILDSSMVNACSSRNKSTTLPWQYPQKELQGASGSVGSALRLYAERREFEVFHAVRLFCAARYYIVRFNARARVSSRVSQASSNFISDAR